MRPLLCMNPVKLSSHSSINYRKSCFTLLPSLQMFLVVVPLDFVKFRLEGILLRNEDSREIVGDVDIKISPVKFVGDVVF